MKDKIAFVGRSNVGKSSTIKRLTGAEVKVGRRPGVTLEPAFIPYGRCTIVDMPGFGFMAGVGGKRQEEVKDFVVSYLEGSEDILFAVQVTDIKAFSEIAARWAGRDEVPLEVEMFLFLKEVGLDPVFVANKIDRIKRPLRDEKLDEACAILGMVPPWRDHRDTVVPFSAKTGEGLGELKNLIRRRCG
ncbi:MAG: GTP-binding protein EngB [Euryarchaeota archaeon]|nr:GTP-binding protein EngB [Euryarchaeota archaeon]